jgi:hypothetical protein
MKTTNATASLAQLEVWAWKQKLYEQLSVLPDNEQILFVQNETHDLIAAIKARKAAKKAEQVSD